MGKECIICGRPLKTGRKYCHIHRSLQHENSTELKEKSNLMGRYLKWLFFSIPLIIIMIVFSRYTNSKNLFTFLLIILIMIGVLAGEYLKKRKNKINLS